MVSDVWSRRQTAVCTYVASAVPSMRWTTGLCAMMHGGARPWPLLTPLGDWRQRACPPTRPDEQRAGPIEAQHLQLLGHNHGLRHHCQSVQEIEAAPPPPTHSGDGHCPVQEMELRHVLRGMAKASAASTGPSSSLSTAVTSATTTRNRSQPPLITLPC